MAAVGSGRVTWEPEALAVTEERGTDPERWPEQRMRLPRPGVLEIGSFSWAASF